MSLATYCQQVTHVGTTKCLQSLLGDKSFGRLKQHFLPNAGPTFSTCYGHVGVCLDGMSFEESWQGDVMPTFPNKTTICNTAKGYILI